MAKNESTDVILHMIDKHQHGKKVILPLAGGTSIGEDGNFTIDDVTATLLLEKTSGFILVKGNGTTVPDLSKDGKTAKEDDEDEEEEDKVEDGLDELTIAELVELAVKGELPEADYVKFKKSKKLMISYLRKQSK